MSVQNGIGTSDVFQIVISDGTVHRLGSYPNINLYPARVFTGTRVFRSLYAFKNPNDHARIHNSIYIGEVFQIEVSDGPVHWRGS